MPVRRLSEWWLRVTVWVPLVPGKLTVWTRLAAA
jgi:hypothetical protein